MNEKKNYTSFGLDRHGLENYFEALSTEHRLRLAFSILSSRAIHLNPFYFESTNSLWTVAGIFVSLSPSVSLACFVDSISLVVLPFIHSWWAERAAIIIGITILCNYTTNLTTCIKTRELTLPPPNIARWQYFDINI